MPLAQCNDHGLVNKIIDYLVDWFTLFMVIVIQNVCQQIVDQWVLAKHSTPTLTQVWVLPCYLTMGPIGGPNKMYRAVEFSCRFKKKKSFSCYFCCFVLFVVYFLFVGFFFVFFCFVFTVFPSGMINDVSFVVFFCIHLFCLGYLWDTIQLLSPIGWATWQHYKLH